MLNFIVYQKQLLKENTLMTEDIWTLKSKIMPKNVP